jgi:hypothetical protein
LVPERKRWSAQGTELAQEGPKAPMMVVEWVREKLTAAASALMWELAWAMMSVSRWALGWVQGLDPVMVQVLAAVLGQRLVEM